MSDPIIQNATILRRLTKEAAHNFENALQKIGDGEWTQHILHEMTYWKTRWNLLCGITLGDQLSDGEVCARARQQRIVIRDQISSKSLPEVEDCYTSTGTFLQAVGLRVRKDLYTILHEMYLEDDSDLENDPDAFLEAYLLGINNYVPNSLEQVPNPYTYGTPPWVAYKEGFQQSQRRYAEWRHNSEYIPPTPEDLRNQYREWYNSYNRNLNQQIAQTL